MTRVSELLREDRVAIYLGDGNRLHPEAGGSPGPELAVAERLLELAFGPLRAQGVLHVTDAAADLQLAPVRDAVAEAEIESILAVPLVAREELIGLLTIYLRRGRELDPNETALLSALASQLAVAAQNAQLHERTERLAAERKEALAAERESTKRLRALYEISRSFAQSLSLDATLEAVTSAAVELLNADAAVIRMKGGRGDQLVPHAPHVADPRLAAALRPLLEREQPIDKLPGRRLFRMGKPLVLDSGTARRLGASYELLVPFLEQGATAVVVPIATSAELVGTLTVVSLDPARRLGDEQVETALFVAGQAALAIENARLTQERKDFADTMQRSLLPRGLPEVDGLEVGAVYESSARLEVGGDVYDFLTLPDGSSPSCSAMRAGTGSRRRRTWRSRSSRSGRSCGSIRIRASSSRRRTRSRSASSRRRKLRDDGVPDRRSRERHCRAASAGHPPVRVLARRRTSRRLAPGGLPLGVETDQRTRAWRRRWPPARLSASTRMGSSKLGVRATSTARTGCTRRSRPGASSRRRRSRSTSWPTREALRASPATITRSSSSAGRRAMAEAVGGERADGAARRRTRFCAGPERPRLLRGAGALATEIGAARLLAPYYGSSTIVWANVIGLVLASLSVGYWIGGKVADRSPSPACSAGSSFSRPCLIAIVPFAARPFLDVSVKGSTRSPRGRRSARSSPCSRCSRRR